MIQRELLMRGLADWDPIDQLLFEVRSVDPARLESLTIDVLASLHRRGLMTIGSITDIGYEAWPGNTDQVVLRAQVELDRLNWSPRGAGFWIANTEAGDEIARRLIAGEDIDLG